jgi:hypothetical protein
MWQSTSAERHMNSSSGYYDYISDNFKQLESNFFTSSLRQRRNDIVFYASMHPKNLPRRIGFYNDISKDNFTLIYTLSGDHKKIINDYQNSKVCLCLHVSVADSAGEYHRMSDVVHAGCVPLFESFADVIAVDLLEKCGGMNFASYDNLIPAAHSLINAISTDIADAMSVRIQRSALWWQEQFRDINFLLLDIFA